MGLRSGMVSEKVHRHFIYPAVLAFRGELQTYPLLRRMRAEQWSAPKDLRERQRESLAAALSHARNHSAWYADRLGPVTDGDPEQVLRAAPILTKRDLQDSGERIRCSRSGWRVHAKTTGGSTGQPVTVYKDARAIAAERAASWMGYGWYGVEIGDRGARFWGSPPPGSARWRRFVLADLAMNRTRFSAFGVSETDFEDYWRRCLEFRPRYLYGYVSMIESFARHVRSRGYDGRRLNLKTVISTSEILTKPQRDVIGQTFASPVCDEYGCGEVGPIAYECNHGMLHEMAMNLFVELLDTDGREVEPGQEGEVVVTDLRNRAMPLLRYRLEDRAIRGRACPCGRGLPAIESVRGREYDFVHTPDGRRFHGEYFMYLIEDLREAGFDIGRFRVMQESRDRVQLQLAARSSGLEDRIRNRLQPDLKDMRIDVAFVDEVSLSSSGKLRIIESRVDRADRE